MEININLVKMKSKNNLYFVEEEEFNLLKDKYKGVDIQGIIERLLEYFEKYKFKDEERIIFNSQIKEYIHFKNLNFKKNIEEEQIEEIPEENIKVDINDCYEQIINILKKYVDMNEDYYSLVALWIIGTWKHDNFETYPYLFLNATKGSAKTRLLKLIKSLSKDAEILNSLTEAVLFRTKGTLCIDEFEGISKMGKENLRELLNSAYKKGTKVKRLKKVKTPTGDEQVIEAFDVYRPICMANIWGMENVLSDRCITIILEKSQDKSRIKLVEDFTDNPIINNLVNSLKSYSVSVGCVCRMGENNVYKDWNNYILNTYTHTQHTYTTQTYTNIHYLDLFSKIDESGIDGRNLELSLPLFLLMFEVNEEKVMEIIRIVGNIIKERKAEDLTSNYDISLIDFLSQEVENDYFIRIAEITKKFIEFLQEQPEWLKNEWVGRALKRLNLIKEKRRASNGIEVRINYEKAKEKIKIFK